MRQSDSAIHTISRYTCPHVTGWSDPRKGTFRKARGPKQSGLIRRNFRKYSRFISAYLKPHAHGSTRLSGEGGREENQNKITSLVRPVLFHHKEKFMRVHFGTSLSSWKRNKKERNRSKKLLPASKIRNHDSAPFSDRMEK